MRNAAIDDVEMAEIDAFVKEQREVMAQADQAIDEIIKMVEASNFHLKKSYCIAARMDVKAAMRDMPRSEFTAWLQAFVEDSRAYLAEFA